MHMSMCEWMLLALLFFFFSSRRRHTRLQGDWSSDVCSSDLPLPGRRNIVVTKQPSYDAAGAEVVSSLQDAFDRADGDVWVIGGASIYEIGRASCRERV